MFSMIGNSILNNKISLCYCDYIRLLGAEDPKSANKPEKITFDDFRIVKSREIPAELFSLSIRQYFGHSDPARLGKSSYLSIMRTIHEHFDYADVIFVADKTYDELYSDCKLPAKTNYPIKLDISFGEFLYRVATVISKESFSGKIDITGISADGQTSGPGGNSSQYLRDNFQILQSSFEYLHKCEVSELFVHPIRNTVTTQEHIINLLCIELESGFPMEILYDFRNFIAINGINVYFPGKVLNEIRHIITPRVLAEEVFPPPLLPE